MHGRVRRVTEKTIEEISEEQAKAKKYVTLEKMCFAMKAKGDYSPTAIELSTKLLSLNPDVTSIWNYRKEYIKNTLAQANLADESRKSFIADELFLTQSIIQNKDTKCYPLWHHRKWLFTLEPSLLTKDEIKLCEKLFLVDERNFHCWNHWKFVCTHLHLSINEMLEFTYKRIEHNFSNYSAWNYRLSLLSEGYINNLIDFDIKEFIDKDLSLILNALYTEPDDQSSWYYQKSLFEFLKSTTIYTNDEINSMIQGRLEEVQELLDMEPDCTLARDAVQYLTTLLL
ncbi:hypothetical protein WA158_004090 [Blastocystis sp. Blastoise]